MIWKVIVDDGLTNCDEYIAVADDIEEAKSKALIQASDYWEKHPEEFTIVSVWKKVE